MVEGTIFIGAAIIAVTEAIKDVAPKVHGWVSVAVAALIGLLVAAFDAELGIASLTLAEGILAGLAAAGTVTVAKKV